LFGVHLTFNAIEWQSNHCSLCPKECVFCVTVWQEAEYGFFAFFHVPVWVNRFVAAPGGLPTFVAVCGL
jgi:hypothetical protein